MKNFSVNGDGSMNKYVKIEYTIVGREYHNLSKCLYYSDVEKGAAAYNTINEMLCSMYEHGLIIRYHLNMDFTEDIQ